MESYFSILIILPGIAIFLARIVDVSLATLPTNSFFITEIINIYCDKEYMTDGKPDVEKINPFVLSMPDNRFFSLGPCIGKV